MTERWEQELQKLRQVGPSDDMWNRAQQPPRGHGMPPGNDRAKAFAVTAVVVALVGAFAWAALRDAAPSGRVPGDSGTPVPTVSGGPSPSVSGEPTPSDQAASWGDPVDVADGRYYVHIDTMGGTDQPTATFDLEYFYKGAEARQQAAADGTTAWPDRWGDDIYVVNDNPKLRTFAVSPDATVTLYKEYQGDPTTTLTPVDGTLADLIAAFNCKKNDLPLVNPMNYDWWITLQDGKIVHLEQSMDVVGDPAPDSVCWSPG